MSQDIISDALNQIKNANNSGKKSVKIMRYSKFLINILEIMRAKKYIDRYEFSKDKKSLEIKIGNVNECQAIKPRLNVKKDSVEKYMRRFLPARNFGIILLSTDKGLLTHEEAMEKNVGGALVAYCY